ncbi:hypothetical protein [Brunnivagina elsteri]|uniref:hypothetical protein n=1 Tax=Brunnivagina elsteri TaxID=1247191 RepID=UPI0013047868|nr:hypothetical protein [Calothrix elsteri]
MINNRDYRTFLLIANPQAPKTILNKILNQALNNLSPNNIHIHQAIEAASLKMNGKK